MAYATTTFHERWRAHVGVQRATLVQIDFVKPTARTVYLADRELGSDRPFGQFWEPVIADNGVAPIDAPCDPLSEGPNLCTTSITLTTKKLGYQTPVTQRLGDALVGYEWQGATVNIWHWIVGEGLPAGEALPVLLNARIVGEPEGRPETIRFDVKQDTSWNRRVPDVKVTKDKYPGASDAIIGGDIWVPVAIGSRESEPLLKPYPSTYGLKNSQEYVGGASLVSGGLVINTGKSGGKVEVIYASHPLHGFGGGSGSDPYIAGDQALGPLVSFTFTNDANGCKLTLNNDSLRALTGVVPIDARTVSTCDDPLNAIDLFNPESFAYLDEAAGKGVLDLILPNLGSLGAYDLVQVLVAYSSLGANLVAVPRNHADNTFGTQVPLPSTGATDLATVAVVQGSWLDNAGNPTGGSLPAPPSWDFGGNGTTVLRDIRIGFATPGNLNKARVYWVALMVRYIPARDVIAPGKLRAVGPRIDVRGRRVRGHFNSAEGQATYSRFENGPDALAQLVADFFATYRGWPDDGSGTITGTAGALIEIPPDVVTLLLTQYGALTLSAIERGAATWGSLVAARGNVTIDGYVPKVGSTIKERGQVQDAIQALARETRSMHLINRFTGKHSWVQWNPTAATATYERTLERGDILGDDLAWYRENEAFVENDLVVKYGWDEFRGRHMHQAALAKNYSSGGYAQDNARDQTLTIATGVNDKVDWREEFFAAVTWGRTAANTIQVPSTTGMAAGMTLISLNGNIAAGTTISNVIDGTHLLLSTDPAAVVFPNDTVDIARLRACTLAAGAYASGQALAAEVKAKMAAQSTAQDIKVEYGAVVVDEVNSYLPVYAGGSLSNLELTARAYASMPDLAAEVQRVLRAGTAYSTWTVTYIPASGHFYVASNGPTFGFAWAYDPAIRVKSCAALLGFDFSGTTAVLPSVALTAEGGFERRGERFLIGRKEGPLSILALTGVNRATSALPTLGYDKRRDYLDTGTLRLWPADYRRGTRENLASSSEADHTQKPPLEIAAGWLNRSNEALDLLHTLFDWRGETRFGMRFSTLRFEDVERGMIFATSSSLDGLGAFPRQGSDGSWGNRLWQVLACRKHCGAGGLYHDEITAIELGSQLFGFGSVAAPAAPTVQSGVFAWTDPRTSNTQAYALKVDSNGADLWTDNGVAVSASVGSSSFAGNCDVCPDGTGGAFVVFCDRRSGVSQIYVQRLTAAGAVASGWPANGLAITSSSGDKSLPVIAADGQGGCIFVWSDANTNPAKGYAQRVNADGTLPTGWSTPVIVFSDASLATGTALGAFKIAADLQGGAYFLSWAGSGAARRVYAQRILSDGTKPAGWDVNLGVQVATGSVTSSVRVGGIVLDGPGSPTVGAMLYYSNSAATACVRRITNAGTFPWAELALSTVGGINDLAFLPAISDGGGGVIVAWADQHSSLRNVYLQRVDITGALVWPSGGVTALATSTASATTSHLEPALVSDAAAGAIVFWQFDPDTSVTGDVIQAQRVIAAGTRAWGTSGVQIATRSNTTSPFPCGAVDGIGGAYVAWVDGFSAAPRPLMAQRVSSAGVNQWGAAIAIRSTAVSSTPANPRAAPAAVA